jgi:hypothetical protein
MDSLSAYGLLFAGTYLQPISVRFVEQLYDVMP